MGRGDAITIGTQALDWLASLQQRARYFAPIGSDGLPQGDGRRALISSPWKRAAGVPASATRGHR
jgi:hypothetical protein